MSPATDAFLIKYDVGYAQRVRFAASAPALHGPIQHPPLHQPAEDVGGAGEGTGR